MKIVWLVNIVMPELAEELGLWKTSLGGWLVGQIDGLRVTDNKVTIITVSNEVDSITFRTINEVDYYVLPKKEHSFLSEQFKKLLDELDPDIFHIFGTETNEAEIAFNIANPLKTVVSIQGLVSIISKHIGNAIPYKYLKSNAIKRIGKILLEGSIIEDDVRRLEKNGERERRLISNAKNIIGRTTWDKACVKKLNPDVNYYSCNEILRSRFYNSQWEINNCERHTIFLSQASSPIKGLHQVLKALPDVIRSYPDTKVYIAGAPLTTFPKRNIIKQVLVEYFFGYQGYVEKLVRQYNLSDHITFLNYLNEDEMKKIYLRSNVFVLPSSIENSPNSLGEAMMLGVPTVAACVGGVQDMLVSPNEGFIYPYDEPYMLAWYICQIFADDDMAIKISGNARLHASKTHSIEINTKKLLKIYEEIIQENSKCDL